MRRCPAVSTMRARGDQVACMQGSGGGDEGSNACCLCQRTVKAKARGQAAVSRTLGNTNGMRVKAPTDKCKNECITNSKCLLTLTLWCPADRSLLSHLQSPTNMHVLLYCMACTTCLAQHQHLVEYGGCSLQEQQGRRGAGGHRGHAWVIFAGKGSGAEGARPSIRRDAAGCCRYHVELHGRAVAGSGQGREGGQCQCALPPSPLRLLPEPLSPLLLLHFLPPPFPRRASHRVHECACRQPSIILCLSPCSEPHALPIPLLTMPCVSLTLLHTACLHNPLSPTPCLSPCFHYLPSE